MKTAIEDAFFAHLPGAEDCVECGYDTCSTNSFVASPRLRPGGRTVAAKVMKSL